MDRSESFESPLIPQSYQHRAESKFPLETQSSANRSQSSEIFPSVHWQEQLLPLSCVAEEDNLTVLRLELETAHRLLQSQQGLIDSLTENQTNQDLQLQHTQVTATRETCDRQSERLIEVESICRDLKTQLRRQQQRVLQYRNLLNERTAHPISFQPTAQVFTETMVSVGYKPIAVESHSVGAQHQCSKTAKPPAVAAWSAPESIDLTGPLACYRKLATIRMTTAMIRMESFSRGSMKATNHSNIHPANSSQPEAVSLGTQSSSRIELPSFTQSSLQ
jgi:hypothetical protein